MNRNDILVIIAIVALVALALTGKVAGEAVVTFLAGLFLDRPSLPGDGV